MTMIKKQILWIKEKLVEMKLTWKESGFKGLYKKYGFKLFLAFFCYYLIRDLIIYVYLPWYFASKLIN